MYDDRHSHHGGHGGRRGHDRQAGRWPVNEASAGLHQAIHSTAAAARQVALSGDADGAAKATALLNEARAKLYRLLAGDAQEPPTPR